MINKIEIGKRLRELRGDKSVEVVSKACGISESAVQMYECGARVPRDEIKVRLAKFFGTTVESIFFYHISPRFVEHTAKGETKMATEKWKVLSNMLGGKQMFIVGRLIDSSQPLHGGNVEYAPDSHYTTDKEKAEKQAEAMNKEQ